MASDDDKILDAIAQNAVEPRRAAGDGQSMEQHSLPDQIAADKYIASKRAASAGGLGGVRIAKIVPPGA